MAEKKVDATTGEVKTPLWGDGVEVPKTPKDKVNREINEEQHGPIAIMSVGPNEVSLEELKIHDPVIHVVHCKPVYNYQSVEFDVEIHEGTKEYDLGYMEGLYTRMLEMLVRVSQNAPQKESKPSAPVEEPASEKQKEILRNFHISFREDITKKQAHALIKKSMDQDIF